MPKYILTDDDRKEILSKSDKFTAKQLSEQYRCSRSTILKLWMDNNYHKPPSFSYYVDDNYFSEINTANKAYIIGLIASDGNIYKRKTKRHQGQLRISLQNGNSEYNLLQYILDDMNATHPIQHNTIKYGDKEREYISFTIVSDQIYNNLIDIGISPKKTWIMDINVVISNIPREFIRDFLRGYFDGDGSIVIPKYKTNFPGKVSANISMPLQSAEKLQSFLSIYNIETRITEDKRKYTYPFGNLCFHGKNKYIFLKWIYYDGCMCLQRKYDKVLHYCRLVEGNPTNRRENIKAIEEYNEFTIQND